ncbi:MAG: pyrroline-5-carboxylate reductase [Candidatus Ornithomonoglobus sp.]
MTIGFIGAGNMGGAIIGGIVSNGIAEPSDIYVADMNKEKAGELQKEYGIKPGTDNAAVAGISDILFLCVKPNVIYSVIEGIKDSVKDNAIVVSIAAGQPIEKLEMAFEDDGLKLVRVMPNTPALVGEGMAAVVPNANTDADDTAKILKIFNSFGRAEQVTEGLMDAVTAVSGSSPAYVFMFIEAMADAAVQGGMPRAQAYTFAAQSVLGSAKMVLETGKHPGELKDMVCSPAGTTIDAVAVLEEEGMRAAVMKAMKACMDKSKSL